MIEVLEQLRFLFLIVMAYLSYRHLSNTPLSITSPQDESEAQEEENNEIQDKETIELQGTIEAQATLLKEEPQQSSTNKIAEQNIEEDKEIRTEPAIEMSSSSQNEKEIIIEEESNEEKLQESIDESDGGELMKLSKTKLIKKTHKPSNKRFKIQPLCSQSQPVEVI